MKSKLLLLFILLYTAISRFFLIDKIPPVLNPSILNGRFMSAILYIVSVLMLFVLVRSYLKNTKIALLSAWVFATIPWVYEQSRIVSQPNFAVGAILTVFFLVQRSSRLLQKVFLLSIPVVIFLVYPQFWIFRIHDFKFSLQQFTQNIFTLFSFDLLFFKNTTFWWGGVRDFGLMYVSFFLFFLAGIYLLIIKKEQKLLLALVIIGVISALSPFFPESREFYLGIPIISLICGLGIYCFNSGANKILRLLLVFLFCAVIYETAQYLHFYFIHYPQQISNNFSQIHEAF